MGIRDERLSRAAEMPHRNLAGDNRLDARLESEIGRLFLERRILEAEYDAAVRYRQIVLEYLDTIDAPEPYGAELGPLESDTCLRRKMLFCSAKTVLRTLGPLVNGTEKENRCSIVVDRVVVYNEPYRGDLEFVALRRGLHELAGLDWPGEKAALLAA